MKVTVYNLKKSETLEIQLTIAINFVRSKCTDEERIMHSKSDNIEVKIKQIKLLHSFLNHFFLDIKSDYKQQLKVALSFIIIVFK